MQPMQNRSKYVFFLMKHVVHDDFLDKCLSCQTIWQAEVDSLTWQQGEEIEKTKNLLVYAT